MAYIFLTPDSTGCLKIAQNDADKQAIMGHHPASSYVQQTISDVDVDNLRLGTHHIKIENGQVIIEQKIENPTFTEEMFLKNYILHTKRAISLFLNNFRNNSNYTQWQSYFDQLSSINTSSFSYPFNKSLEQHFRDSNLPYYSILELP